MPRYLLRVMYDGTDFRGWQVQCAGRSIQGDLIDAFRQLGVRHPGVTGSGRTDAGVHALAHFAHFDYRGRMSPRQLRLGLNTKLGNDLLVTGVWPVPDSFHARFQAMSRGYLYLLSREQNPLNRLHTGFVPLSGIRLEDLRDLSVVLTGSHDFSSLSRDNPLVPNHICEITRLEITEKDGVIRFEIVADRFLHNMVRRIVGTICNLSHQGLGVEVLAKILADKDPRQRLVLPAPACGLYLKSVAYPDMSLDETTPSP